MDRQVFRAVAFRRNGTENPVKQMAYFVPNRCRSIPPVRACKTLADDFFRFVSWLGVYARTAGNSGKPVSVRFALKLSVFWLKTGKF
jgi:hypothetical protein